MARNVRGDLLHENYARHQNQNTLYVSSDDVLVFAKESDALVEYEFLCDVPIVL
jgi:hypothetical protein